MESNVPAASEAQATSAADAQPVVQAQNAFIQRLTSYSIVNSSWETIKGGYEAAKNYSPVIKSGLEKAEEMSQRVYTVAEPHVRPIVISLSERYALDEKGHIVLDKIEATADKVMTTVQDAKARVEESKQVAANAYHAGKDAASARTQQLIQTGNRPLNHFLDLAEVIVDKILPPTLQHSPADASSSSSESEPPSGEEEARLVANPIMRAAALGTDVTRRVRNAAAALPVLPALSFRSPAEIAEMTHVVDLIQYAAQYIDVEGQRARIASVVEATQGRIAEAKEAAQARIQAVQDTVAEKVQPVKALIEAQTADLKDKSTQQVVALVSSIAHISEMLRHNATASQIVHSAEERREQLQARLAEIVGQAKNYVQTLNEQQLRDYATSVQTQSAAALAVLVGILNQSTTSLTGTSVTSALLSWTNTLAARLGYQVVPLRVEGPISSTTTTEANPAPKQ